MNGLYGPTTGADADADTDTNGPSLVYPYFHQHPRLEFSTTPTHFIKERDRYISVDDELYNAAAGGDLVKMRSARERGATNIDRAFRFATGTSRLDAMWLLYKEWGATLPYCDDEFLRDLPEKTQNLLMQWTQPKVKSALKK